MSNRKLQKEVEAIFKKIHEGLDLFNYYFSRHESSTNDSQREKLESDLKKEIKKLQKFRDQIKTWQGNDALEATIASSKLQEHRRLVEEAMECYKEVEKNSKMKSFSNQSIMLASRENGEHDLSPEVEEAFDYLSGVFDELQEQNEALEEEYEKISQKKVRKNNLQAIEERKQELESFKNRNEFHMAKIEAVLSYLKANKISVQSVWEIQEDLTFYVESNQEPDFIDDETLYDDLIKEARENHEKNAIVLNENSTAAELSLTVSADASLENMPLTESSSGTGLKQQPSNAKGVLEAIGRRPSLSPDMSEAPSKTTVTPKGKPLSKSLILESSSPAFVTTLKPASTPSKPVAGLKWSIAAAGTSQSENTPPSSPLFSRHKSQDASIACNRTQGSKPTQDTPKSLPQSRSSQADFKTDQSEVDASSELLSLLTKNEEYSPYLEVLKNSRLTSVEFDLFKDLDLLKCPPGIQEFATSFTAANKLSSSGMILNKQLNYSPFLSQLSNSFQPSVQTSLRDGRTFPKPPIFVGKLHSYWSRIRSGNNFNVLFDEIQALEEENTAESLILGKELVMVLFYGYYFGYLPLENIIAESLLHKLGWNPYDHNITSEPFDKANLKSCVWLRKIVASGVHGNIRTEADSEDFKVFDASVWEITVKYGFKLDPRMSR